MNQFLDEDPRPREDELLAQGYNLSFYLQQNQYYRNQDFGILRLLFFQLSHPLLSLHVKEHVKEG